LVFTDLPLAGWKRSISCIIETGSCGTQIDIGAPWFEQRPLDAGAGNVGSDEVLGRGDFVDFVDVDDSVLRQLDVIVRFAHEVPHQILDVAAHIPRLAELGGVALDERHPQLGGDELDDVSLAHPGRPIMRRCSDPARITQSDPSPLGRSGCG
jgi:hypothetical protein